MKAALWARLKSAGPLLDFNSEVQRFLLWLPPYMGPVIARGRWWQRRYRDTAGVEARMDIEQQALSDLRRLLINVPERPLIHEFLMRAEQAHSRSLAVRQEALGGKTVDTGLDDELIDGMLQWLEDRYQHREIAAWLARMLCAWRTERNPHSGL